MKRNKILTGILLVAFMIIGVGFAVITSTLEIDGSVTSTVSDSTFVVKFTEVDDTSVATINSSDPKTATITISNWTKAGDTKTVKFTVTNASETATKLNAELGTPTITNSNETYYTVSATWGDTTTIAPGATAELSVTVTLIKTPIDADAEANAYKSTFKVSFNATAVQQST